MNEIFLKNKISIEDQSDPCKLINDICLKQSSIYYLETTRYDFNYLMTRQYSLYLTYVNISISHRDSLTIQYGLESRSDNTIINDLNKSETNSILIILVRSEVISASLIFYFNLDTSDSSVIEVLRCRKKNSSFSRTLDFQCWFFFFTKVI